MVGGRKKISGLVFPFLIVAIISSSGSVLAGGGGEKERAKKWLKDARDTLALVEKTAKELIDAGIEKKADENPAVKGEWESAKSWLKMAKEELKKAEKLCKKKKWKDCANTANWAWQLLVKAATQALNAGRAAGLK